MHAWWTRGILAPSGSGPRPRPQCTLALQALLPAGLWVPSPPTAPSSPWTAPPHRVALGLLGAAAASARRPAPCSQGCPALAARAASGLWCWSACSLFPWQGHAGLQGVPGTSTCLPLSVSPHFLLCCSPSLQAQLPPWGGLAERSPGLQHQGLPLLSDPHPAEPSRGCWGSLPRTSAHPSRLQGAGAGRLAVRG